MRLDERKILSRRVLDRTQARRSDERNGPRECRAVTTPISSARRTKREGSSPRGDEEARKRDGLSSPDRSRIYPSSTFFSPSHRLSLRYPRPRVGHVLWKLPHTVTCHDHGSDRSDDVAIVELQRVLEQSIFLSAPIEGKPSAGI